MGRLFLVRHGQASFLSQNYDQLSSLGETQARLLGSYWAGRGMIFDRAGTGPSQRHRRSAQIAAEAYREAGLGFPEPMVMNEFEEFQGDAVLTQNLPQLRERDPKIRELHDALQAANAEQQKRAAFSRLFEAVIVRWVNGDIATQGAESWQEFRARVNRGLAGLAADSGKGANVAVFTSGGPIGVAMQLALHLSAEDTLRTMWMSRNSSYSEFLFSGDRFTLSSFNSYPHLKDDSLLTYR